jgi:putative Holliday junction resolvase
LRILGLDVGDRRIGVAVSDPMGWTAQGIATVVRQESRDRSINEIKDIINNYKVEKIVVGLPKNMNNTLGPQGEKVMVYAKALADACNKSVEFYDERMSTMAVERTLIEADMSRKKRKTVIDKLSAVYILQAYLDSHAK